MLFGKEYQDYYFIPLLFKFRAISLGIHCVFDERTSLLNKREV